MPKACLVLVLHAGCLQPNPDFKTSSGQGSGSDDSGGMGIVGAASEQSSTSVPDSGSTDSSVEADAATTIGSGTASTTGESEGTAERHLIFLSSGQLPPNFWGIDVADGACQAFATDAGLAGDWVAVISDANVAVRDRVVIGGPIRNMVDELVANDDADLWDGAIQAAIQYDEYGEAVAADKLPWTGSMSDGAAASQQLDRRCWRSGGGSRICARYRLHLARKRQHLVQSRPSALLSQRMTAGGPHGSSGYDERA